MTPQEQAVWERMQAAGDRRDWPEHRRLQQELIALQDRPWTRSQPVPGTRNTPDRSREVVAYCTTWDALTLQHDNEGRALLVHTPRGVVDDHLASRPDIPVIVNHEGQRVGQFTDLSPDDYGLLTTAVYDDTPAGRQALDDISAGKYRAYSCHIRPSEQRSTGEYRDGLAVHEVSRGELVEAGPCDDPNDPQARILTIGGIDARDVWPVGPVDFEDGLAQLEAVTGLTTDSILEQARRGRYANQEAAKETVRRIDRARSALKTSRRRAVVLYWEWRQTKVSATYSLYREADQEADAHLAALSEMLCHDRELIREACRSIEPKVDLVAQIASGGRRRAA